MSAGSFVDTDVASHSRAVRSATTAALLVAILIIIGGGVVRVTGSGLGCPQWPSCTEDSFTSVTADTGVHGLIEFTNRALTAVITLAVVVVVITVWRERVLTGIVRRTLWWSAWAQLLMVVLNAVVGGVTVWTGLNPYVVSAHFLAAMLLLSSTAISYDVAHRGRPTVSPHSATTKLAWAVVALGIPLIVAGAVLTGAGPHPGDSAAVHRIPLNWTLLTGAHGILAFAMLIAAGLCAVTAGRHGDALAKRRALTLVAVLLTQGTVGVYQSITGLPSIAVVVHLLGAALTWVGVVRLLLASRTHHGDAAAPRNDSTVRRAELF